ncbi:hypothetical protein Tco_1058989, partial [Tanacetum coccineum]
NDVGSNILASDIGVVENVATRECPFDYPPDALIDVGSQPPFLSTVATSTSMMSASDSVSINFNKVLFAPNMSLVTKVGSSSSLPATDSAVDIYWQSDLDDYENVEDFSLFKNIHDVKGRKFSIEAKVAGTFGSLSLERQHHERDGNHAETQQRVNDLSQSQLNANEPDASSHEPRWHCFEV